MSVMIRRRLALFLFLVLGATACGNDRGTQDIMGVLRDAFTPRTKAQAAVIPQSQIDEVLAATDASLILVTFEERQQQTMMLQIGSNGPYRTYATSSRQTITLKNGLVTATRGLGGDLMSADIDGSLALISARRSGQTRRVMRFLDGEDKIRELAFDCEISRSGRSGQIVTMQETCRSGGNAISGQFAVDGNGRVRRSRQWVGQVNGYVSLRTLRN